MIDHWPAVIQNPRYHAPTLAAVEHVIFSSGSLPRIAFDGFELVELRGIPPFHASKAG